MTTTFHPIVIGIKDKTEIGAIMNSIMVNLKNNIEENTGDFIEFATKQTKYIAKLETKRFAFRGDLEKGISHRVFKKSKRGEVFVRGDQEAKAMMNEFGTEGKFIPNRGKVSDWVRMKAPQFADSKVVPVGNPKNLPYSKSHVILNRSKNKFWGIARGKADKDLDNMFAHYIGKAIAKS